MTAREYKQLESLLNKARAVCADADVEACSPAGERADAHYDAFTNALDAVGACQLYLGMPDVFSDLSYLPVVAS